MTIHESAQAADMSAEQALLGMMLRSSDACADASSFCRPALLEEPFHRRIFQTILDMFESGEPVVPIKVRARMKGDPAWKELPAEYLEALKSAAPAHDNAVLIIDSLRNALADRTGIERKSFTVKSLAHLPAVVTSDYLVKGILAPEEVSVIYGEPGSGKSFLATWIGYRLASDLPVLGRRTRQAAVIYVALEGQIGFERRIRALRDALGEAPGFYWIVQPLDLYGGEGDADGIVTAALLANAGVIIIDTLARAIGAGSENEGRDMGIMIQAIDHIRRETGAHICIVHHSGKDSTRGMRGHSSLLGAADVALEVKRDGDSRSVKVVKSKDGKDGDEHGFTLDVVDLVADDDGDQITTCIVRETGEPAGTGKARLSGATKIALDLLIRASNDAGQPPPAGAHFPRDISVVPLNLWRRYCYEGGAADRDNADKSRKAFNRARTTLQNLGRIGTWGDFVWLT